MLEDVANGDAFGIVREIREDLAQGGVVIQLVLLHQQLDRGSGELLAYRGQAEVGRRSYRNPLFDIGHAVAAGEQRLAFRDHQHRRPGFIITPVGGKKLVDCFFRIAAAGE